MQMKIAWDVDLSNTWTNPQSHDVMLVSYAPKVTGLLLPPTGFSSCSRLKVLLQRVPATHSASQAFALVLLSFDPCFASCSQWSSVTPSVSSLQNLTLWRKLPAPSIPAGCVSADQGCFARLLLSTPAWDASSTLLASLVLESRSEVGIPPYFIFSDHGHRLGVDSFWSVHPLSLLLFRHLKDWCFMWRMPSWDLLWPKLQHWRLQTPHGVSP